MLSLCSFLSASILFAAPSWENLGGSFQGKPVSVTGSDGRLEVFVRGTDNALWFASQTSPGGSWTPFVSLGGVINSNPTAITDRTGASRSSHWVFTTAPSGRDRRLRLVSIIIRTGRASAAMERAMWRWRRRGQSRMIRSTKRKCSCGAAITPCGTYQITMRAVSLFWGARPAGRTGAVWADI